MIRLILNALFSGFGRGLGDAISTHTVFRLPRFRSRTSKVALTGAAFLTLALPITAQYEGLRLKAYLDPVGIPTICYGETQNVTLNDRKSKAVCDKMLAMRLTWFGIHVKRRVNVPMSDTMHAALTSFTYNVGEDAFARSTLLKKLNRGDYRGACNELPRWKYAKGKVLRGLIKRRAAERALCLENIDDISV